MKNELNKIIDALKSINYKEYLKQFPLDKVVNEKFLVQEQPLKWEPVDSNNKTPIRADKDDLVRLHFLIRFLKARIVLEFGVGKSTKIMVDAINLNELKYLNMVGQCLRVKEPFMVHSVDNSESWLDKINKEMQNTKNLVTYFSPCEMGIFNDRICTFYNKVPNIRPDFIYLDAPSQFGINGAIRGLSTEHPDRMPMAADLLALEYFLEPGTFIVVDGRTANARFLKNNFQRDWQYSYEEVFDQHFFYLGEEPLGIWNKAAIDFVDL